MKVGTLMLCAIWFAGGVLASVGYVLGWFDELAVALIALIAIPLGVEVRSIRRRLER